MLLENNKSTNADATAATAVRNNNVLQSIKKSAMLKSNNEMKNINGIG